MKILVSFIGNSDPVRGGYDGPMLHIARHNRPDKIFLLLTKRMQQEERKTYLNKAIQHLMRTQSRNIDIEFINLDAENPAQFINFGFTAIFDDLLNKHSDAEYIVNITSGTPQMIAAMCLEIVTNNRMMKTMQVYNPDPGSSHVESLDEFDYDFDQNLDNLDEAKNRCVETDIFSFKIAQQKLILENKVSSYDYAGALEILNRNPFMNKDALFQLIEHGYHCDKLRNVTDQVANEYGLMRANATNRVNKIINYYLAWELENKRNDHIILILRMTPLIYELSKYILIAKGKNKRPNLSIWRALEQNRKIDHGMLSQIDPDIPKDLGVSHRNPFFATTFHLLNLFDAFDISDCLSELKSLREIEEYARNQIAHEVDIVKLNMDNIKKKSNMSIKLVEKIIKHFFSPYLPNINLNFFEDLNQHILEKIKEIEE